MTNPLLSVHALGCECRERPIIEQVSFEISHGEWIALIGRNGAGKSTLLKALMGLRSYSGSIAIEGRDAKSLLKKDLSKRVAYLSQQPPHSSSATVHQLLLFSRFSRQRNVWRHDEVDLQIVEKVLQLLHLTPFASRRISTLSGGELQRVMIGSCLVQEPLLLLLDEPTSALDPVAKSEVWGTLRELREALNFSILVATHDLTTVLRSATRVLALTAGTLSFDGTPAQLLDEAPWHRIYGHTIRTGRDDRDGAPIVYGVE